MFENTKTYNFDGHTIVVYTGAFKAEVIFDGVIIDQFRSCKMREAFTNGLCLETSYKGYEIRVRIGAGMPFTMITTFINNTLMED